MKREPVTRVWLKEVLIFNPTLDPTEDKRVTVEKIHRGAATVRKHWGYHGLERIALLWLFRVGLPMLTTKEADALRKKATGAYSYRWEGEFLTDRPDPEYRGGWYTESARDVKREMEEEQKRNDQDN